MFKKVNIRNDPPSLFLNLLEKEPEEYREKFHKFWKDAKYYDIYNKNIDGEAVSLAIVRMTKEDYELFMKEKSLENYLEERKLCDYICQFPHSEWRRAIGEYQIYSTIFRNGIESIFTKTDYILENDIVHFPKAAKGIKCRCLKKDHFYDNRMTIFITMMYTYIKNEVESNY